MSGHHHGHHIIIIVLPQGGDMCGNSTNCHTFHSQSVPSTGCFLDWLKLSASVCCRIEVSVCVPSTGHAADSVPPGV